MRLVIVSGLSGSGKSVALNMLEDLGWYCVDNIPAGLLNAFIEHSVINPNRIYERSAVGLDARNEPEELDGIPALVRDLRDRGIACDLIFLRAEQPMLLRRYGETRRRHPLVREGVNLPEAIDEELALLEPIAYSADLVVDTSRTSVHELREMIRARVAPRESGRLSIMFQSFGFKHGTPSSADFVFDARTLPNPYWDPTLQPLNGLDPEVIAFLEREPSVKALLDDIIDFIEKRIPLYQENNRAYLTVAVGCTGGQHRSVYIVNRLTEYFAARYPDVIAYHELLQRNA
jgi:RNase adapter protein RapZ